MLAGMHFMDSYNYDVERVKRCVIHYAAPNGKIYPFCAYNSGPVYRERIEREFSVPLEEQEEEMKRLDPQGTQRLRKLCQRAGAGGVRLRTKAADSNFGTRRAIRDEGLGCEVVRLQHPENPRPDRYAEMPLADILLGRPWPRKKIRDSA